MNPKITMLNHASVNFTMDGVSLTTDPWFTGSVFDSGWSLRFPTPPIARSILENSDLIYISHEHPDHFSPATLRSIDKRKRQHMTVLYQQTKDKKVKNWCLANGFNFCELKPNQWTKISVNCQVILGTHPFDDTWLAMRINDCTILNTNDCVLNEKSMANIKNLVGPVNVLLSQFSYAGWCGNENEEGLRKSASDAVLKRLKLQCEILGPEHVIPFASSFYFSAIDNFYMNDRANTLPHVLGELDADGLSSIGMAPGQSWVLGERHSNETAINLWESIDVETLPKNQFPTILLEELVSASTVWVNRLKDRNNRFLLHICHLMGFVSEINIRIIDLDKVCRFSPVAGLKQISTANTDIDLHSSAFHFLISHDYGVDTLLVNSRMRLSDGSMKLFLRTFGLGKLNNTGRSLCFKLVFDLRYLLAILHRVFLSPAKDELGREGVRA
jgi:UDP-MurNAc hydroxylase